MVNVNGENALSINVTGNVSIGTDISLNGATGQQEFIRVGLVRAVGHPVVRLRNTDQFSNLHPALNGQGPGGGRGYEIGKSTGGGSYGE